VPTFSTDKTYEDSQILTESQLDAAFSSVETFLNTTKLDSANIQDGAIESANISAGSITTAKIASNAVTRAKLEAVGQQISASCGSFSTTSTTNVDVTNLSVTITTTGRPVMLKLIADGTTGHSYIQQATANTRSVLEFIRDSTAIGNYYLGSDGTIILVPSPSISMLDIPAAGTYTYKLQAKVVGGGTSSVFNTKLAAFEL
jgi:hypothetical protein